MAIRDLRVSYQLAEQALKHPKGFADCLLKEGLPADAHIVGCSWDPRGDIVLRVMTVEEGGDIVPVYMRECAVGGEDPVSMGFIGGIKA